MGNRRPLDGIVVVDLTRALSGPICTSMLADFGARVLKVEDLKGDLTRGGVYNPKLKPDPISGGDSFNAINRNKDGICLNLRSAEGKEIFYGLLKKADVLISNYRPGTTKQMGIDYDTVKELNPRLIACEIAAFREKGRETEAGFDGVVQSAAGIIACTGYPGEPPAKPGPSLADVSAGMVMMQGILLALFNREKTGKGQAVSVKMQDSAMFLMAQYATQLVDIPDYDVQPNGMCQFEATPSNGFKTKDGYVFIAPAGGKLYEDFAELIGRPDIVTDPRFADPNNRRKNRQILFDEILNPIFLTKTTDEWYKLMSAKGLPVSPIVSPKTAWMRAYENGAPIVAEINHSVHGKMHTVGVAVDLSETPGRVEKPAPLLGQNTEEVLRDMVGLSDEKIREFEEKGVVRCYRAPK